MTETGKRANEREHQVEKNRGQRLKTLIELGPLLAFFAAYLLSKNMVVSTGALMIATCIALVLSWRVFGNIPVMPLVSGVLVLTFGGLTLWLNDPVFIKMKPTILYGLFAAGLAIGLWFKQYFLRYAFGELFLLTDEGWRLLTIRWVMFFVVLALLNEVVWRHSSDETWLWFKLAVLPITAIFGAAQIGLLKQHAASAASN